MRCYFDFFHMTQVLPIVSCCLLLSLRIPWLQCVNSFGNQLEKTGKMWKCLSKCEPPHIKITPDKEDAQESNSSYEKKKITNISKQLDKRETTAENPLNAHSSFPSINWKSRATLCWPGRPRKFQPWVWLTVKFWPKSWVNPFEEMPIFQLT